VDATGHGRDEMDEVSEEETGGSLVSSWSGTLTVESGTVPEVDWA